MKTLSPYYRSHVRERGKYVVGVIHGPYGAICTCSAKDAQKIVDLANDDLATRTANILHHVAIRKYNRAHI